jgi:hypothetical protein
MYVLLFLICAYDVLKELKATIYFYAFIYNNGHRQVTFWVLPI